MSGDVQPRKRKDKKRKKDDLGIEEPRGTSAVFGEGDVFIHSHHEHGTGGHWCAKIIFFSLLAVLITLIGLIILENRGLSELEANAVESRYSGVLEGWLEDDPDDDHHDEHTLELTHHDDDDNAYDEDTQHLEEGGDDEEMEHSDEDDEESLGDEEDNDEQSDEDDNEQANDDEPADQDDVEEANDNYDEEDDERGYDDDDDELEDENDDRQGDDENEESQEQDMQNDEDEEDNDDYHYKKHFRLESEEDEEKNNNSEEDDGNDDNDEYYEQNETPDISNEIDNRDENNDDKDEHDEEEDADEDVELEKLEREESEELNKEPISTELPALPEDDDDDDDYSENDKDEDDSTEVGQEGDESEGPQEEEYLEAEDIEESSVVERITAPPGKPFVEVEEDVSSEKPPDTLAEEEEYEKRQEELRREEEQSSHMWLKLTVGGALLVATHAVMRRATRDSQEEEEPADENETILTDRRMTLLPDEPPASVPVKKVVEEIPQPKIEKRPETVFPMVKPTIIKKQESEEDEKQSDEEEIQEINPTDDKELFSDEEEDEVIVETPKLIPKNNSSVVETKQESEPEEDEDDPDDVEIIDDEQLEEELEDEDDEEISDVDDAELLTRLEAKYGKLPEPDRPGQKHKDGGNSIDDDWPGEPNDAYWRRQLDSAERELRQGEWSSAAEHAGVASLRDSARARWVVARALDLSAEANRDNSLLSRAIAAYLNLLKMNERLSDKKLLQVTERTLDRIQFRGSYLNAEPVYRLLIRRFPDNPAYRNNMTISFLMANRADLAEDALKETLKLWPDDRVALAHYGFVLKTSHNRYEEAIEAFQKALEGDEGPATESRFYYHYGDSLLLLGRRDEAHEVHKRGAALGHFLSPAQRSLYNVPRLKSSPWWKIEDTPYARLAKALEKSWKEILKEAEAAKALYEQDKEGLKERGEWSQLDLFVRGREIPGRCKRAPVTCSVVKSEPSAVGCRRGQIKFSSMAAGTHVRPHVGPTNCRLRMHLGLSNTKDTYIRVDKEIRQWQTGKTLLFDDSFEHEVWHNGTGTRLVLIVDVWHPELTANERRQLPAI